MRPRIIYRLFSLIILSLLRVFFLSFYVHKLLVFCFLCVVFFSNFSLLFLASKNETLFPLVFYGILLWLFFSLENLCLHLKSSLGLPLSLSLSLSLVVIGLFSLGGGGGLSQQIFPVILRTIGKLNNQAREKNIEVHIQMLTYMPTALLQRKAIEETKAILPRLKKQIEEAQAKVERLQVSFLCCCSVKERSLPSPFSSILPLLSTSFTLFSMYLLHVFDMGMKKGPD
jgi:hypothetical protein